MSRVLFLLARVCGGGAFHFSLQDCRTSGSRAPAQLACRAEGQQVRRAPKGREAMNHQSPWHATLHGLRAAGQCRRMRCPLMDNADHRPAIRRASPVAACARQCGVKGDEGHGCEACWVETRPVEQRAQTCRRTQDTGHAGHRIQKWISDQWAWVNGATEPARRGSDIKVEC